MRIIDKLEKIGTDNVIKCLQDLNMLKIKLIKLLVS